MSALLSLLAGNSAKPSFKAVILGLDGSGKTTLLYRLLRGEFIESPPTIGFNAEAVRHARATVTLLDAPWASRNLCALRHLYLPGTQAVVFVVDCTDADRLLAKRNDVNTNNIHNSNNNNSNNKKTNATNSDSTVSESFTNNPEYMLESVEGMLHFYLNREEVPAGCPVLLLLNKRDLPARESVESIVNSLRLYRYTSEQAEKRFRVAVYACSVSTGEGVSEGLDWLVDALLSSSSSSSAHTTLPHKAEVRDAVPHADTLSEWLRREDEPDSEFLQSVWQRSLAPSLCDHYALLRLIWVVLTRFGRQDGIPLIFMLTKDLFLFPVPSPPQQRSTIGSEKREKRYNESIVYFWISMVHYALQEASSLSSNAVHSRDFKTFLVCNPQLSDEEIYLRYFSVDKLWSNHSLDTSGSPDESSGEAEIVLPDIKPLPSVLSQKSRENMPKIDRKRVARVLPAVDTLSDALFLELCLRQRLPSWGHTARLRLLYIGLVMHGRQKGGVDRVLSLAQRVEKQGFHLTLAYFWVHTVAMHMQTVYKREGGLGGLPPSCFGALTDESKLNSDDCFELISHAMPFSEFIKRKSTESLSDSLLYTKYYSREALDRADAVTTFVVPDLQSLPSVLVGEG